MSRSAARVPRLATLSLLVAALLAACAGELGTQGEALRFLSVDLPDAPINEPYRAPVHAVGGLRPYEFRLETGSLPPGIQIVNGVLQGTPTTLGSFSFTLAVSDANLSSTFQEFALDVVEPPPPTLTLSPPETEVRGSVTLRARVADARGLAGLSTVVTWNPELFTLADGSLAASSDDVALFELLGDGRLQVDLAMLRGTLDGTAELFRFALQPTGAANFLSVTSSTAFASRRGGELLTETEVRTEGREPVIEAPEPVEEPPEPETQDQEP